MKKIRALVGGSPYHAALLASEINNYHEGIEAKAEQPPFPGNKVVKVLPQIVNADIYHGIYWDDCYKNFFAAKLLGRKIVCHWIGTDVYQVLRDKKRSLAMKVLNRIIDIHLAGSLGLVEELKTINIKASWVPLIPGDFKTQIYSLPASPAVVAFIPEERPDFYKLSVLYELAASFQNVRFEHDGLSLMVLEALSRGRQVIWSEQFPHCYYARDTASAKAALLKIINNPEINHNGASYVQETFNKNKIIGGLVEIYKGLIGR
jgi:hypothetical protein